MQTVLLTGAAGLVGRAATEVLGASGYAVRPFDLADGDDVRDEGCVRRAMVGCRAVVHAAAVPHDSRGTPGEIVATNVLGTWHVLLAAEEQRVARVVYLSSVQAFGFADGERPPDYLPVDDRHPLRASRPYGMSKRLAETMCEAWTARTGIATVVLRPVLVVSRERARSIRRSDVELDAFVHVDDVADAIVKAVSGPVDGHVRAILCGPGRYVTDVAQQVLGWHPIHDRWLES